MRTLQLLSVYAVAAVLAVLAPANLSATGKERVFQFGLFPPVSSNGISSGETVNLVSINLIGGYNAGNRIFELGTVWNASREFTTGVQVAGLLNVGGDVAGVQISPLINVARSLKGVQIGLINYVGDAGKGVSIGLINIARHGGKYEFEISASEVVNAYVSFRFGTDRFYTILSGGVCSLYSQMEYAVGVGFGTSINWKKNWGSQIEILAFGLSRDRSLTDNMSNSIVMLRLPVSKTFAKHFKIFFGPTINMGLQDIREQDSQLAPWTMWTASFDGLHAAGWIGLAAGLRF